MQNFIPYGRQVIEPDDIEAVVDVLKSDYLTCGPMVKAFEDALKDYFDASEAITVSSGTAALHCALLSLDIKAGDAVFLAANTFAASANSILYCGATPVFVDIENDTRCLDPAQLTAAIKLAEQKGLNPKAVILVHFGGMPGKILEINQICKTYDLFLIEDACHAPGAEYQAEDGSWLKVGSCYHSDVACFSFHPVKHIAAGEGGCITTRNPDIAEKARFFSQHGITRDSQKFESRIFPTEDRGPWYYEMQLLGFNYRLSDIHCALGLSQLKKIDASVQRRREIAEFYKEAFCQSEHIRISQREDTTRKCSYHLFVIDLVTCRDYKQKKIFLQNLSNRGIGSQVHYIPIYWLPYYQDNQQLWLKMDTPITEKHYQFALSIPMWAKLGETELSRITQEIKTYSKEVLKRL